MVQTALSTLISIYISCPRRRRHVLKLLNWCRPVRERQQRATSVANVRDAAPGIVADLTANGVGLGVDRRALLAAAFKARRQSSYEIECQTALLLPETFCMICCLMFLFFTSLLPVYGYLSTRNTNP